MTANSAFILSALLYGALGLALAVCTYTDLHSRRIPNVATLPLMLVALIIHSLHAWPLGLFFSLKGLALGFALLFPAYLLGGLGAGDVKLMAAVGAVLGAAETFTAFLVIAVLGGVAALAMMAWRREMLLRLKRLGAGFSLILFGRTLDGLRVHDRSRLKREGIPYGAVIAVGTTLSVGYRLYTGGSLAGLLPWIVPAVVPQI